MKIVEFSIRRPVTVVMLMAALCIFGWISFDKLPINLLPDISYPTLTVRTNYTGTAPNEIETLISKPIEDAVSIIPNVVRVTSISRPDVSDVVIEFDWKTNMDFASLNVREKLDLVTLPKEAEQPVLLRFDPSLDPIMRISLYGEESLVALRLIAEEEIKPVLEGLAGEVREGGSLLGAGLSGRGGVAAVKVSGGLQEEIHVEIQEAKLASLGIPISKVAARLKEENVNLTGGSIKEGEAEYLIRTFNEFKRVEEIDDIVLDVKNNVPIVLGDVSTVTKGYKERSVITRLNGRESLEIAIFKEADANTVTVARLIKEKLEGLNESLKKFSNNLKMEIVFDQSRFIEQSIKEVVNTAILGGILAVIILFFFLRTLKTTLIIGFSIPLSIVATFFFMYISGVSLNIMSLGGLALGIGMLVDNSIVVLESIERYRQKGLNSFEAANRGASDVVSAVMASTFTTVCVFFPIVFVKGIAGQLFRDTALTVCFSLLTSLFVAITLIPMLASLSNWAIFELLLLLVQKGFLVVLYPFLKVFNLVYSAVERTYPKVISFAISHKLIVIGCTIAALGSSWFAYKGLGMELIPEMSQGEFFINIKKPAGTPLEITLDTIKQMEGIVMRNPYVKKIYSIAGSTSQSGGSASEEREYVGGINVTLKDDVTPEQEEQVIDSLRDAFKDSPAVENKFSRPAYFSLATPIEVEIKGYDLRILEKISEQVLAAFKPIPWVTDIKPSPPRQGNPEIQIVFNRQKLAQLGLNIDTVGSLIRSNVLGEVGTEFSRRDRKIDVRVRARRPDVESVEDIKRLVINPEAKIPVTLGSVADIGIEEGPSEIRRIDRNRVVVVYANIKGTDLKTAIQEIEKRMANIFLPKDYEIRVSGQSREMRIAVPSMVFAGALAIFLVYLVMAAQFESLLHPFVIMFTIPFGIIGVALALYITRQLISIVALIGVVMLSGIVVNNAIVLIDCINRRRQEGLERREAIIEAGKMRLRPILMTTLTTILGLIPLSLGIGKGAELRSPMGITVIGGLAASTILTLVVIPTVYELFERMRLFFKKIGKT
ncbi:MAG TPA: efflux RND transporter permease subunit [Candidatus Brocadiia bacterium]|nr:efflux RND transporter permease subunit [Candidatus Brocadiales bacterium]